MKDLWSLFWQLVALRRGPEDMPRSVVLMITVVIIDMALGIACDWLSGPARWNGLSSVGSSGVELVLDVITLWALLRFKTVEGRYTQSLVAIYASDLLLSVCAVPLIVLMAHLPTQSPVGLVAFMLELLLIGWSLGVRGFIYHRSLRIGLFQGNMLSIALFLLTATINFRLFPAIASKMS